MGSRAAPTGQYDADPPGAVRAPVHAHDERRIVDAIEVARRLVEEAARIDRASSRRERRRRARMRTLVRDPAAAEFTVALTDEVPRIPVAGAAASRFRSLVIAADLRGLGLADRLALRAAAAAARLAPSFVMGLVVARLRRESEGVILPAEDPRFAEHVHRRTLGGMGCNVNVLGEAILGEAEARRRLDAVLARIARPDVDYVSVKISAIAAGISALAFDATVERVSERLRELYRAADRTQPAAFVNLDMEEYRDLAITLAAFRRVLDEPEFEHLDAGVVLQAYLPEVAGVARELGGWAARRHARSRGRIKVRLVKGANLAMETVEAELRGWEPAPYAAKADVDANYKRVLDALLDPEFDDSVSVGVASHNLFDVAWALGLRDELTSAGRPPRIEIEMLEGMAPAQSQAVAERAGGLLLYAPVVARSDFPAALAYLVRRLDENTASDNFLAHLFDLGDRQRFDAEAAKFAAAVRARHAPAGERRRRVVRPGEPVTPSLDAPFANSIDTDWTVPEHRRWVADALAPASADVPGPQRYVAPTVTEVDEAVEAAAAALDSWSARPLRDRASVIDRVGAVFEEHRGRILAAMAREAGKSIAEGDPEVSEAVDFARYYARSALRAEAVEGAVPAPLGPIVVTPPWNFPFAIPAGGALAALVAGNTVILKPAPQTRAVGALVAELCWEAGVPRDALQLVAADDDVAGQRLVTHPAVAAVVLTGAHATAQMFLTWRPDLRLLAETSGKNAIVVTAAADLDHAVTDIVSSAFGHAGQKCSAASLAIVEAPVHDDPRFLERVRDAAATLRVGEPDDPATDVGPLIEAPGPTLRRALTQLEPGESWLLRPEPRSADGRLWSPGIRLGVLPGSWFARTECFGPVLGIVRAVDLGDAIAIQNSVDYGLTAGLQSLDPAEVERWTERVDAGNLYVNRGITGAIVRRQPFGGWKRSTVGPTAKAGGPNYVATLCRWNDAGHAIDRIEADFGEWMRGVGRREHDPTGLRAERNAFRYRPLAGGVCVRFAAGVGVRELAIAAAAARATGARLVLSDARREAADSFAARLPSLGIARLRPLGDGADDAEHTIRRAAHASGIAVDDAPPVGAPEVELPRWLREQSISMTAHRHGRVAGHRNRA